MQRFLQGIFCCIMVNFIIIPLQSQILQTQNSADYLIVTPSVFEPLVKDFASWRTQKGYRVTTVTIEQIQKEFPRPGHPLQEIVREFISYTLEKWQNPAPRFVLLVGDASFIPTFRISSPAFSSLGEDSVSVDEFYTHNKFKGNIRANVMIGRFPAATKAELLTMINKTRFFEEMNSRSSYRYDMTVLNSNDQSDNNVFEEFASYFVNGVQQHKINVHSISYKYDINSIQQTKETIAQSMNSGSVYFSYYGHGSAYDWGKRRIFSASDVDVVLEKNKRPFIFTGASCSHRFDVPNNLVTKLLTFEEGGAVATIASTGIIYIDQGAMFMDKFYNAMLQPNSSIKTIGEAFLAAKKEPYTLYASSGGDREWLRFTLLGDPALLIPQQLATTSIAKADETNGYAVPTVSPNPFSDVTTIRFSLSEPSPVSFTVVNTLGQVVFQSTPSRYSAGEHNIVVDLSGKGSGIYYYQIIMGGRSEKGILNLTR